MLNAMMTVEELTALITDACKPLDLKVIKLQNTTANLGVKPEYLLARAMLRIVRGE